jgi:RNA polymerase sigma factor (sigma-70 family)
MQSGNSHIQEKFIVERHIRQVNNETEEAIMAADLDRRAQLAIAGLPPKRKAIFHMVRDSNMSYQQVADKLHISVKTVEAQMTEALRYLRTFPFGHGTINHRRTCKSSFFLYCCCRSCDVLIATL